MGWFLDALLLMEEILHQLRLVVYPIIYRVLQSYTSHVVGNGISSINSIHLHQQHPCPAHPDPLGTRRNGSVRYDFPGTGGKGESGEEVGSETLNWPRLNHQSTYPLVH